MAGSVNKVILIGNLGKDPEVKYLEGGIAVAKFPIATSETYKDRNTGEKKSTTEWHNIVLWRGLAEVAEKYLSKGKLVYIEGKLRTRTWEDQAGNKKYMTEVVGDNMTMLGGRRDEDPQSDTSAEAVSESSAADPAADKAVAENPIADKEASETTIAEENSTDDLPF